MTPEVVSVLQAAIAGGYLLAALLILSKRESYRHSVALLTVIVVGHFMLLVLRGLMQGQLPIVTRYEDLTTDSLFVAVVYLSIQWRWRELRRPAALMLVVAAGTAACALYYGQDFYPWTPSLRSIWLTLHAPLNALAIALGSFCASVALLGAKEQMRSCARILWWVLLLWLAMLATGSYWAYLAWGRFWGWDSIESWSLATGLAYASVCHRLLSPSADIAVVSRWALIPFVMMLFTTYGLLLVRYSMHGQYYFR